MKISLRIEERDLLKFELNNLLLYIDNYVNENQDSKNNIAVNENRTIVEKLLSKICDMDKKSKPTSGYNICDT